MSDHVRIRNNYVYTLSYPDSMGGNVFYVGKGRDDRFKNHAAEARRGVQSPKCDIIRSIWQHGAKVVMDKVYEHLGDVEALELERELIYAIGYENLVNFPPRTKDRTYRGENYGSTQLL